MPVDSTMEVFYSVEELSQRFKVQQEEIVKVAAEKEFAQHNINGVTCLRKDDLEKFVDELFSSINVSYQTYYEIPDSLNNSTSPWAVTLAKMYKEKFNCPASVSPAQGDLLKTLVSNTAPKTVVEIGCYTGISTIWLASGLEQTGKQGTIHSIDLFDDIIPNPPFHCGALNNPLEYAQKSVEAAQLSHRVKFYKNNSLEIGERISEVIDAPIDLIYIDGDHTKEGCYKDFILYYLHVAVGGYIIFHDIYPEFCGWDGPRYVIDNFIKNSPNFELLEIKTSPANYGIAVVRKLREDRNLGLRAKLRKTKIWQSLKGQPLGNFIKNRMG